MRIAEFLARRRRSAPAYGGLASARPALVFLSLAVLSGCSILPPITRAGFEAVDESASPSNQPAAMAELPAAAGAPIAVLQTEAHDVLTQRIVLKGDPGTLGENAIVVKVNEARGPWDIDGPIGLPTRTMIATELDQSFAGVDMQLTNSFQRNSFGPFGYAIGHPTPRVTCVYAWQFGVFKWSKLGEAPSGEPSMPVRPTSVRVRLCRSATGEAEMVGMLRELQVFPPNSRVAYVDPNYSGGERGGDALAAAGIGNFVNPSAAARPVRRAEVAPKPHPRKEAHHRPHHERVVDDVEERAAAEDPPDRNAVNVPMPGGARAAAPAPSAANPLLAPLAATPQAAADDMPLPSRSAAAARATPAPAPAPAKSSFVPLPN